MKTLIWLCFLSWVLLAATAMSPGQDYPKLSPFEAVAWKGENVEVAVLGKSYRLVSINGLEVDRILRFAKDSYGRKWQERFAEDLVQVLSEMGHPPEDRVRLDLVSVETGKPVRLDDVRMTHENRQRLLFANKASGPRKRDDREIPKLSPFQGVRWPAEGVEVLVDGEWYRLERFGDLEADRMLELTRRRFGSVWQKRFSEDLVEVLAALEHLPDDRRVDLVLRAADGTSVERRDVLMTEENRRAVWTLNNRGQGLAVEVSRVSRKHGRGSRRYAELVERLPVAEGSPRLSAEQVGEDLDQLEWLLENTHSYRHLRGIDLAAALDTIRQRAREGLSRNELALALHRFIGSLGDGHARLDESLDDVLGGRYTPFLLGDAAEGIVAFRPDRSGWLDPERPFVATIDGLPAEKWIEAGMSLGRRGSEPFERRHGLRSVRHLDYCRQILGRLIRDRVSVELSSAGGKNRRALELETASRRPIYGEWPKRPCGRLNGDVGYLRIPSMDNDPLVVAALVEKLGELLDTKGLILDVRGNGGGSRDILRELFPCFMPENAEPQVVNVGALRRTPGLPAEAREGFLGDRYLFPRSASIWSDEERAAVQRFAESFQPGWRLGEGEFSDWHYLVLSPRAAKHRYGRPVVVLMDTGCFSATDIFLGAFAELDQVTLIGTASGGGSGRARPAQLANSGLRVRLSSMASFRPSGETYDGNGISPDIVVKPSAEFFVGEDDPALEKALAVLE